MVFFLQPGILVALVASVGRKIVCRRQSGTGFWLRDAYRVIVPVPSNKSQTQRLKPLLVCQHGRTGGPPPGWLISRRQPELPGGDH
jgi:hypothetical protein